jgi:putative ABC transport system ATP-binding protein
MAIAGARTAGARVQLEHVTRTFEHGAPILRGASLVVEPGEIVAVAGRSGSGKTTLLQLIGGLDQPDDGDVWVDDVHVSAIRRPVTLRRTTVGFVFQLHHLLPVLSAQANVELPLVAARAPRHERRERALEALGRVGLADRAHDRPEQLSGGERQRVAVARAIVHRPRLVLADEPTGGLDQASAVQILSLLARLRDTEGTTVIVVSHDPTLGGYADRRILLQDGELRPGAAGQTPVPA